VNFTGSQFLDLIHVDIWLAAESETLVQNGSVFEKVQTVMST